MSTKPPLSSKDNDQAVLTVSQLNRLAKQLLEECFASIMVEGEISNFSTPASGHWYFSLKDERAQLRCAMFKNHNFRLRFKPKAGQKVIAKGQISLYEGRGDYQLIIQDLQPAGIGSLALAFEQLKEKLASEGLFAADHKHPLPVHPRHVAIISSATGAAIRDMITVFKRRNPSIKLTLLPCLVQGDNASKSICRQLERVNRLYSSGEMAFDAVIVGRGGGSLEDLWAFNEENVARAIANCVLPIVSAVGHEVDFTISDFVADTRAATPSAAAELLSNDQQNVLKTLNHYQSRLLQHWAHYRDNLRFQVEHLSARLRHPGETLREYAQTLDQLEHRLGKAAEFVIAEKQHQFTLIEGELWQNSPQLQLQQHQIKLDHLRGQLINSAENTIDSSRSALQNQMSILNAVSPLRVLERGYAVVTNQRNKVVTKAKQAKTGDILKARLSEGSINLKVLEPTTLTQTEDSQ